MIHSIRVGVGVVLVAWSTGATAAGEDITAAAFGDIYDTSDGGRPMGKGGGFGTPPSGDTWYTTWAGDDTLYVNVDDGLGFEDPGRKHVMLRNCLCMLTGNPNESTGDFRGVNLNPGSRGATMPNSRFEGLQGYTSSLYEQDGVLYQIRHAWSPTDALWPPLDSSIIKSPDGGRNWLDHLGRKNAPLPARADAMFPALPWSWLTFVQYGRGGAAPPVDRAGQYVYLTAGEHLARVPRERLARLNKADFQYYKGQGLDGMLDSSWSGTPADAGKMSYAGPGRSIANVVYNFGLKRYVATGCQAYRAAKALGAEPEDAVRDLHRRAPLGTVEDRDELRPVGPRGLEHADGQQVHLRQRPEDVVHVQRRVQGRPLVLRLPLHAAVPVRRRGGPLRGRGRRAERRTGRVGLSRAAPAPATSRTSPSPATGPSSTSTTSTAPAGTSYGSGTRRPKTTAT